MGVTPVTQLQYETLTWKNPSEFKGTAIPMHRVSWHEAMEFCKRLSYGTGKKARLPTEAEWEYACRAGTTTRFNFGDDQEELGEYAWHSQNNDGVQIHPVCQKKPNGWGLYDMHGNVHQWCWDWFDLYSAFIVTDPTGPPEGNCRILRGGCVHPSKCGSAYRDGLPPEFHFRNVGFRVVLEAG
ncbi:MAG: formylglycine-generating enzyme family protein [Thermoguttaceae bacterium]